MHKNKNNHFKEAKDTIIDAKKSIIIKGAKVNNLKNINLHIPKYKLVVFTGVSGSGKSSIVFDTIYAEGQRRYVESLSSYARQFLEKINKPDVEYISGLAPTMAIEQKARVKNPRSTVGTMTEVYDYLRLLFARIGIIYSPVSGKPVKKDTPETIIEDILKSYDNNNIKLYVFCSLRIENLDELQIKISSLKEKGFFRIISGKDVIDLNDLSFKEIINIVRKNNGNYILDFLIDRLILNKANYDEISRLNDSIETAFRENDGYVTIRIYNGKKFQDYNYNKFLELDGIRFEETEPALFSFNNAYGACEKCNGFGRTMDIDMDLVIPDKNKSVSGGAITIFNTPKHSKHLTDMINEADLYGVDVNIPFFLLDDKAKNFIFNGGKKYIGINKFFRYVEKEASYKLHYRVLLNRYRSYTICSNCSGSRLRKEALYIKINGKSIHDICRMKIRDSYRFFSKLKLNTYEKKISERILEEILSRLKYLNEVGLDYLTLDRLSNSLSGGEFQRINLSTSLGSSLTDSVYVLDEPSIGLHPRDNKKLINIMKSLCNMGNSVLVVEHDKEIIRGADEIIDIGPKAGENGGEVIYQGNYKNILKCENSITGKFLSGNLKIETPVSRRKINNNLKSILIKGAREHNLKNIDVRIPLNAFTCITGVSGSGKSTLVNDILYNGLLKKLDGYCENRIGEHDRIEGIQNINAVQLIDQSPIGKTPRSNPVTYIKAFDLIRDAFANTNEAKRKHLSSGYFSFNVPGGRCETCEGTGIIRVEMQFMADIFLECEVCRGKRYKMDVLEINLRGNDGHLKNISEILEMTISQALIFFKPYSRIVKKLKILDDVGLEYIKLGQASNTLSGGESQRVKLAYHLSYQDDEFHTLFIFDEPTTGLHYYDINKLLKCFNELIKKGNSVLVIEHNLEVIKCADYVIDLGPESGDEGGFIVAQGTPEEIAKVKKSYTGKYLKEYF